MLYRVLVVGVQHPSGQLVHVAPNPIPVFLYGSRVIPAVPPSIQHLLAFLALLLLNHFSGLLQHALEHRLVLHGEHRFAGPLDLLVQNLHAVVRCLGGLPVNLGSELLLLIKAALFCSLFLELLQFGKALVEYLQCVSLTVSQLVHAQLAGRILEHFPVRQGVGALLILRRNSLCYRSLCKKLLWDVFQEAFINGVDFCEQICYADHRRARALGNAGFGIPLLYDLVFFYALKRYCDIQGILFITKFLYFKFYWNYILAIFKGTYQNVCVF